jgi:hypothetical protein
LYILPAAPRWHGAILLAALALACVSVLAAETDAIAVSLHLCIGVDQDSDGVTDCDQDCVDGDPAIFPGAPERCDGVDNQCPGDGGHGQTDEGCDDDGDDYCDDDMTTIGNPPVCPHGGGDCDDEPTGDGSSVNPSATEVCNDIDDDCDGLIDEDAAGEDSDSDGYRNLCDNCPSGYNPGQADDDGDGHGPPCDCDDTPGSGAEFYPGAPEINDGLDNQCSGDYGHGVADEITGNCGFHNPLDADEYSCDPPQVGAVVYQYVRWGEPAFTGSCVTGTTDDTVWVDLEWPASGEAFYYLTRPLSPHMGSWGQSFIPPLTERAFACGSETDCVNGIDDDGDYLTDCSDPDCAGDPAC